MPEVPKMPEMEKMPTIDNAIEMSKRMMIGYAYAQDVVISACRGFCQLFRGDSYLGAMIAWHVLKAKVEVSPAECIRYFEHDKERKYKKFDGMGVLRPMLFGTLEFEFGTHPKELVCKSFVADIAGCDISNTLISSGHRHFQALARLAPHCWILNLKCALYCTTEYTYQGASNRMCQCAFRQSATLAMPRGRLFGKAEVYFVGNQCDITDEFESTCEMCNTCRIWMRGELQQRDFAKLGNESSCVHRTFMPNGHNCCICKIDRGTLKGVLIMDKWSQGAIVGATLDDYFDATRDLSKTVVNACEHDGFCLNDPVVSVTTQQTITQDAPIQATSTTSTTTSITTSITTPTISISATTTSTTVSTSATAATQPSTPKRKKTTTIGTVPSRPDWHKRGPREPLVRDDTKRRKLNFM